MNKKTHFSYNLWTQIGDFELVSSSSLLYSQRFGRYVLWTSLGVCQTQEPIRNFEPHPLFNPRRLLFLILLTITRYKY